MEEKQKGTKTLADFGNSDIENLLNHSKVSYVFFAFRT